MNRAALLILLLLASPAVPPKATAAQLGYTVYVFGLPVADAVMGVDMASSAYRVMLRFHTTGIVHMFAGDSLDEHTTGQLENDQPFPFEFGSSGRMHGRDRLVSMTWHEGMPTVAAIDPPNTAEREPVPAALLAHTVDPLDAIVLLLHQVRRTGRCEGTTRAYDGRRLQLLEAQTVGEDEVGRSLRSDFSGHALRCQFTDQTLAGYRTTGSGRDDDMRVHRGTIWLAQVLPGAQKVPVRASVETRWWGDAMIYLTSASP
jgi:hypothetical protein